MKKLILFTLTSMLSFNVYAVKLKFAVLTPKQNSWGKALDAMTKEIKKATNGDVEFKIFYGGVKGDEPVVKRLVNTDLLDGGIFTGKTLGEINGDARVMELPFTFYHNREKALNTLNKLAPYFDQGFEKKDFVNLGFFELGNVYFVSQKKTENIDSLKGLKIWSWPGDDLVDAMIKEMNLISVPAPLPDVLSSLQTGIIEAAYAPPLGIVALQWNTKVKYLVNFPISYSTGAFLVSKKAWAKIPAKHQQTVREVAKKYINEVNLANLGDNKVAMEEMKKSGVEFLKFSDDDIKKAEAFRSKIIERLIKQGTLFSQDAVSKLESELGKL